jgi:hypothetical protein
MAHTLSEQVLTEVVSRIAGAAITRYTCVKLHTTEGQVIMSTDNDVPFGVALETVASGEPVRICTLGIAPCTAAGAIALNAVVHPAGAAGIIDDDGANGEFALGWALRVASAAGDIIPIRVNVHQIAA